MPSADSQAAKIKLKKKTATIKVGKKVTLKVKGTKKKAKWSSSKKSVATVSQKGVVKGKKAGKATITAKIGKKKYRCKVTVQATKKSKGYTPSGYTPPSNTNTSSNNSSNSSGSNQQNGSNTNSVTPAQLAANVEVKMGKILSGVYLLVTNRNSVWLSSLEIGYNLCDSSGTVLASDTETFAVLKPGGSQICPIALSDETRDAIDISKTRVNKTVTQNSLVSYKDVSSSVHCTSQKTESGEITCTVKNNTGEYIVYDYYIYYYDAAGKLVDIGFFAGDLSNGGANTQYFTPPYTFDDDYNQVYQYSTYKVAINAAAVIG